MTEEVGQLIKCTAGRGRPRLARIVEVLETGVIRIEYMDGGARVLLIRADRKNNAAPITYTGAVLIDGKYHLLHPFAKHEKRIGPYAFADEREARRRDRRLKRQRSQARLLQQWIPALDEESAFRVVKRRRLREIDLPEQEITNARAFVDWLTQ